MEFLELLNMKKIRKGAVYLLCVIVTLSLQNMLLARISFWGVHAIIMPALVVAIGIFEGGVWGAAFGLVAGGLCDMTTLDSTATYMVLYAILGFGGGFLTEFLINRRFFSYMVLTLAALLITGGCQIVPLWIFRSTPLVGLLPTMLLQTVCSLPFAAGIYFAVKAIAVKRKEQ